MLTNSKANQIQQQSVTSKGLDVSSGENFTASPIFDLLIIDEKSATLFEFAQPQKKLKGWGLFKGLKIDEEEIKATKKSFFPEREF